MAGHFTHYQQGYLRVSMTGCGPERFLNICSGRNIEIWDVICEKGRYEFFITVKGFKDTKDLVRKAGVRLRIVKKLGLPFFLYRNRKRKLFFAGFLFFFLFLYTMSLFLWNIEIYGNSRYSCDTLMDFLKANDVTMGMMTNRIHCEDIERAIRQEFSEITWVSAQVSGTRLLVKIKENEVLSYIPPKDTSPCDIVADKPGRITKMIVRQGIAQVKPGDEVKPGQILISGIIRITDDGDGVVAEHPVHADGDIYAETTEVFEKSCSSWRRVEGYTGKKQTGLSVRVLGKELIFLPKRLFPQSLLQLDKREKKPWKFSMEERQIRLFENFYLPFYWGMIRGKEYEIYEKPYSKEEKEELKEKINSLFLEKLREKGVQIIGNNVRIQEGNGSFTILCTAKTEEIIGESRPLTLENRENLQEGETENSSGNIP